MSTPEAQLRDTLCRVALSLYQRGYVHATAGNISARLDDGACLITPTDACLGTLDPARLARVEADGRQTAGDPASKTLALHRAIYAAAPEARCVLHTHSTHLVALSLLRDAAAAAVPVAAATAVAAPATALDGPVAAGAPPDDLLPPITPYFVMKVGHVPLIPYHRPGDPQVALLVAQRIRQMAERGTPIRAVMLSRLGPNVWHRSPELASAVLEELEETARLWLLCQPRPRPLPPPALDDLGRQFGAAW
jgi:ribulose-5-phosphate 4-epimerase/fuculose-1-phosphate aldolase